MSETSPQWLGSELKCICSVYVPVTNPLKSAEWWQKNLGLDFAVPYNPAESHAIMRLTDGQWLHLVETDGPFHNEFRNKAGYEMFRFTFEVRQIEVLHDHLISNGVKVEDLKDRGSCGINFVFYDLHGNKFDVNEVVTAHRTPQEVDKAKEHLFRFGE